MCIKYNVENLDLAVKGCYACPQQGQMSSGPISTTVKSNTSYPYTFIRTLLNSFELN